MRYDNARGYAFERMHAEVEHFRSAVSGGESQHNAFRNATGWAAIAAAYALNAPPVVMGAPVPDEEVSGATAGGWTEATVDPWVSLTGADIPGHTLELSYLGRGRFCLRHTTDYDEGSEERSVTFIDIIEGEARLTNEVRS